MISKLQVTFPVSPLKFYIFSTIKKLRQLSFYRRLVLVIVN
jgi:hypothetical protein